MWTFEDTRAAYMQGWAPFHQDNGTYRIQKLDDPQGVAHDHDFTFQGHEFPSDSIALEFVITQAKNGDQLAQRALKLCRDSQA